MIPIAFRFTCSAEHWSTVTFDTQGTRAEAMRTARAAGWRPCSEIIRGGRSLAAWWCPSCVARSQR